MPSLTNKQIAPFLEAAREAKKIRERDGFLRPTQCSVIVELDERLKTAVELLTCDTYYECEFRSAQEFLDVCPGEKFGDPPGPCREHRRRAFLKSIGVEP